MADEPTKGFLAELLTAFKTREGLSNRELADVLKLSHPTVGAIINRTSDVQLSTLWTLSDHFEWSVGELGRAAFECEPAPKKKGHRSKRAP